MPRTPDNLEASARANETARVMRKHERAIAEAERVKSEAAMEEVIQAICREHGWDRSKVIVHIQRRGR